MFELKLKEDVLDSEIALTEKLLAEDSLLAGGMMIEAELELGAASEAATTELNAVSLLAATEVFSDDEASAGLELLGNTPGRLLAAASELFEDWVVIAEEETSGVLLTGADLLPPPPPQALNANASTVTDNALREYILILSMIVLLVLTAH